MLAIKILNQNNEFAGWFSYGNVEYQWKKKKNEFNIVQFRALKNELLIFNDNDLYETDIINEHLKELNLWFNSNEKYKDYSYKIVQFEFKELGYKYDL